MYKILLVEDDINIVNHLSSFLEKEGFLITYVDGQKKAIELIKNQHFDLALLDISLKEGNGYSLYNEIKSYKDIPIVFLTANQDILRRYHKQETFYQYQNIKVNPLTGKVFKDNHEIFLSALEYRLLLIFFSYPNQLLTREFLLEEIWNITGEDVSDNTLSVYMKRIRNKIEDNPQNPNIIKTMRGLGYKLGD